MDDGHGGRGRIRIGFQLFRRRAFGGESFDELREEVQCRGNHYRDEQRHQDECTYDVEKGMGCRGALGFSCAVEGGEPCGYGCADVHAENGRSRSFESNDVFGQQGHGDCRSRGGALDNGGEHQRHDEAFQETGDRACVERSEDLKNGVIVLDRLETFFHPVKSHEDEAEAHKGETDVVGRFFVDEEVENRADGNYGKAQQPDAGNERDKPCGSRCSDVGAYDYVDRLGQVQKPG